MHHPSPASARPEEFTIPLSLLAWLFSAAALALPSPWRRATVGVPPFWLALGGLQVALNVKGTTDLQSALAAAAPAPHFLETTAALLLTGLASALVAGGILIAGADRSLRERGPAALALVTALIAAGHLMPLWRAVHPLETAAIAAGLVGVAVGVWWLAGVLRLRGGVRGADRWLGAGKAPIAKAETPGSRGLITALAAALILALLPNTTTLLAGTILSAWLLHLWFRRLGAVPAFPVLVLTTIGLARLGWLLLTVAGSWAPSLASLPDAPLSPAAGLWMTPWLLLAAWGLLGQWPLQSLVPPPWLALLAGLLLLRVGVAAIPDGLLGYQAVVAPVVVLSLWWAVATTRVAMGLSALGLFGAIAVPEQGAVWLLLPFGAASLFLAAARIPITHRELIVKGLILLAAVGLWPALVAGLHTQVVYTVLCVAALSAAGASTGADSPYHP